MTALAKNPGFRGRGLIGRFAYILPANRLGNRQVNLAPIPDVVQNSYH